MRYGLVCFVFLLTTVLCAQTSIEGTAPANYRNQLVHLDILDDHLDVVTIADYQILAETEIDSSGRFSFAELILPEAPSLYRLRYRMREAPPVSMHFLQRHYLTVVMNEGDTLKIDGLKPIDPDPINYKISVAEAGLDQYQSVGLTTGSDRQETEADKLGREYLRSFLHDPAADPYARVYALGKLGYEQPTAEDVLAGDAALRQTALPASYRRTLDRELGAFAYHRLSSQNSWLRVALGASLLLCVVLTYFLLRRSSERKPLPEETATSPTDALTDKEQEVFTLVAEGRSNKEVAAALFVSVSTIKTHLNNIYRKLGVASRGDLVEMRGEVDSTGV